MITKHFFMALCDHRDAWGEGGGIKCDTEPRLTSKSMNRHSFSTVQTTSIIKRSHNNDRLAMCVCLCVCDYAQKITVTISITPSL